MSDLASQAGEPPPGGPPVTQCSGSPPPLSEIRRLPRGSGEGACSRFVNTDADWRGRGFGQAMTAQALRAARCSGASKASLDARCRPVDLPPDRVRKCRHAHALHDPDLTAHRSDRDEVPPLFTEAQPGWDVALG